MKTLRQIRGFFLGAVLLISMSACQTLQYRTVQSDFERAVQAELTGSDSPYIDWYENVSATLTDQYISGLDPKLRPNAWMLRSFSEWRSRQYEQAKTSSENGLAALGQIGDAWAHSRESILLTMLKGLVQDSQLRDRLQAEARPLGIDRYNSVFAPGFKAATRQLHAALNKAGAPTPVSVRDYWNYHCWRILQNWNFSLGQLPAGEPESASAYTDADVFIGNEFRSLGWTNMTHAIAAVKQAIPDGHPYRRLIAIEESR